MAHILKLYKRLLKERKKIKSKKIERDTHERVHNIIILL